MTALTVVPDHPDTSELLAESSLLIQRATAIVVDSQERYVAAGEFGKGCRMLQKKIRAFFAPHKTRAHDVHAGLCADENAQLAMPEQAVQIVALKMIDYKNAEDARLEKERLDREERARKLEADRRIQEALDAEDDGDLIGAELALMEPLSIPLPPTRTAPKVSGVAPTKRWTFDEGVVHLAAVVKHVAGVEKLAHPELLCMLALSTPDVRRLITAMKGEFNVPGIRAYEADGISFGSK